MDDTLRTALSLAKIDTFTYSISEKVFTRHEPSIDGADRKLAVTEADLFARIHPDDRQRVVEAIDETLRRERPLQTDCRMVSAVGDVSHVSITAVVDSDSMTVSGVIVDLTAERQQRNAAEALKHQLNSLLDAIPSPVILFDEHLVIQAINAEFAEAMGVAVDEFNGQSFFEAMPLGNGSDFELNYRRAVKNVEEVEFEFHFVPFNEWFRVSIVPVDSGFISFTRSISDIKELEALLREQEQQLLQSERMRVVGQLAGGMAHDFNNQLAVVLGYADLLRSELVETRQRGYADRIMQAGDQASALSRRMLAFGNQGEPVKEIVNLNTIVNEVVALIAPTARCAITAADPGDSEFLVFGDSTQLQSAVLNLVLNARDAVVAPGECIVDVSSELLLKPMLGQHGESVSPGPVACVRVSDTGPGMDDDTLRQAFDPFFSTRGAGRGLGLNAVYNTAKQAGGAVRLTSSVEHGTVAQLFLPSYTAPEVVLSEPIVEPAVDNAPIRSATVLVVEDNELVGGFALEGLTSLGLDTIRATSGEEAIEAFQRYGADIDLVYLDWVMPGMHGRDVLRQFKVLKPELPVIIASGFMTSTFDEGRSPSDAFLPKPFTLEQLRAAVVEAQREA